MMTVAQTIFATMEMFSVASILCFIVLILTNNDDLAIPYGWFAVIGTIITVAFGLANFYHP